MNVPSPSDVPLRETEIRPDHLRRGQEERFAADIRRLMQRKGEFVDVACPACDARHAHGGFEKYGLTYARCGGCGTVYVCPRPGPDILAWYYAASENYAYWNRVLFPASEEVRRERIFRPRAERVADICRRHGVPGGVLVEVGAGFGTFGEEVRKLSCFDRVIAIEPTPDLAETCRRKGLEVIEKPVEQVRIDDQSVDVVASFEVLEHLFSPRDFLQHCAALLSPGGLLILTCPNIRGFDLLVLEALSDTVDVEHLNYFHPDSLAQLVSACGFEVLESMTPGQLDAELVRKKALAGAIDLSAQPFLKHILIDAWERAGSAFQRFLADNRLSSHMWLVARKPVGGSHARA